MVAPIEKISDLVFSLLSFAPFANKPISYGAKRLSLDNNFEVAL